MAYKETVLYSATPNNITINGDFTLSGVPTNYDKIRVNYTNYNYTTGGPTAWGTYAVPFYTFEFNPSTHSIGNFEAPMWNGLTTSTGGQVYRSCCQRKNMNTSAWAINFNTTAANTSRTCTNSNWRNTVESVIGIKYNAENVTPTRKCVLYNGTAPTGGELHSFTLSEPPSAFDRIGILTNVRQYRYSAYQNQYPIQRYAEFPYWLLSGENAVLATNDLMVGGPYGTLMRCVSIYTGCSGTNWQQVNGFRGNGQTVNTTTIDDSTSIIRQVIGIKL